VFWVLNSIVPIVKTSGERADLPQNVIELVVRRIGAESEPRERVIPVVSEHLLERLGSVPADGGRVVVRHEHQVCPAVVVGDHLERLRETVVRPGDAHHGVVCIGIVQGTMTAPFRKRRTVPVGHEIPGRNAHCTRQQWYRNQWLKWGGQGAQPTPCSDLSPLQ